MRSQIALTVRAVFLRLAFFIVVENFALFFGPFCFLVVLCCVIVASLTLSLRFCMPFPCCFRRVLVALCWLLHAVSLLFCPGSLLLRVKSLLLCVVSSLFCVVCLLHRVKSLLHRVKSLLLPAVSMLFRAVT